MLDYIVQILISISVIITPIGIIAAIILGAISHFEKNTPRKAMIRKWAIRCFLGPIIFLITILIVWGFFNLITHTITG